VLSCEKEARMAKYEPLRAFLTDRSDSEVPLRFEDIERIIGAPLPPVAFKHRAWWSNNPSNSVMTKAWLEAGYRAERVDMGSRKLVFRRAGDEPEATSGANWLAALRAELGGSVQISPGFDLTEPTGEIWDAERS
jgi:hypothetical protein